MATTPKSYKKGSYTYRESSPGSNKYQNFTAAKPVEKKPVAKAVATPKPRPVASKAVSSGKPGESAMSRAEVTRPTVKAVRDESRMAKAEATRVRTPMVKTLDTRTPFPMGKGTAAIPKKADPGQAKRYPGRNMDKQRRGMGMYPNQRSVMVR